MGNEKEEKNHPLTTIEYPHKALKVVLLVMVALNLLSSGVWRSLMSIAAAAPHTHNPISVGYVACQVSSSAFTLVEWRENCIRRHSCKRDE